MAATPREIVEVRLEGDIDLEAVPAVRLTLLKALRANPGCTVQVDMSRVTFLDSSGMGMLVGVHKQAVAAGAVLRIVNPHERVEFVLAVARLDAVLCDS